MESSCHQYILSYIALYSAITSIWNFYVDTLVSVNVLRHRCGTRVWYAVLGVGSMCIPIPWQIRGNYDCEFNHWYNYIWIYIMGFNSSPPGQNCLHFAHVVFRCIFVNEKVCILNKISLRFVPKAPIHNNPALPYRRQAIIWTNADSANRRIYAAPGGDELINRVDRKIMLYFLVAAIDVTNKYLLWHLNWKYGGGRGSFKI